MPMTAARPRAQNSRKRQTWNVVNGLDKRATPKSDEMQAVQARQQVQLRMTGEEHYCFMRPELGRACGQCPAPWNRPSERRARGQHKE